MFIEILLFLLICLSIEAKPSNQRYTDFESGENDLSPLNTNQSQSTTPLPAPLLPIVNSPIQTTPLSILQQHRQILANHLYGQVQDFSINENPNTQQPRDPFNDDPSSGQQINNPTLKTNGNISPMLLNEKLMTRQAGNFGQSQLAIINELPTQQMELPKPIVPEVVVRGAAIQDSRLMRSPFRFSSCQQPFL